jgi:hypothetical protein
LATENIPIITGSPSGITSTRVKWTQPILVTTLFFETFFWQFRGVHLWTLGVSGYGR